ncbi:MAG: FAD-dependent monooxygenase [Gammaproteobacteria bacterium]|nr:FAD-dependent monooxygenase [Gammaproteobacteria bacterium]
MSTSTYDVVVSGAGIVGLAAAHMFTHHGYKTLVVDRDQSPDTTGRLGADLRTIALSPVASTQLQALGIDLPSRTGCIESMHVWESDGSSAITMTANEVQEPRLAFVFENKSIAAALKARRHDRLQTNLNGRITGIDVDARSIEIDNASTFHTDLLVVAEGSNSSTCQLLGSTLDIDQELQEHAIATIVKTDAPHKNSAWQVFGPSPLALLPLSEPNMLSLIWSLPSDVSARTMELSDCEFMKCLNRTCEEVVGTVTEVDRRMSFPLHQRLVSDFNPLPWVLILGDAAHTIHPLAGQGVNLGLEDVRAVENVLKGGPQRLNTPNMWRTFNAKRKLRAAAMVQLMSFFSSIYALQSPYMRLIRNMGVNWVNTNEGLKRQIIKEAMGFGPIARVL